MDYFSKSDPMCVMYTQDVKSQRFIEVDILFSFRFSRKSVFLRAVTVSLPVTL